MRIDLLLQREPFAIILTQTLSRFWAEQYGLSFSARWLARPAAPEVRSTVGVQHWLVNVYLNAIFTPDVDPIVLDPIRREFSRSLVWWKRPLQQAYVTLALSQGTAGWLAQAMLAITPEVPGAAYKLIVAGNHKVRLLDRRADRAYGILKEGFNDRFLRRELAGRQAAVACQVPVPDLLEVARGVWWFSERYVSGTPINRLANDSEAGRAAQVVATALQRLLVATQQPVALEQYLEGLRAQVRREVAGSRILGAVERQVILQQAEALVQAAIELAGVGSKPIVTALTHGDFQPANILLNADGVWLIDWEYSARRQIGYDALVYALAARFPSGLSARLADFTEKGWPLSVAPTVSSWPNLPMQDRSSRELFVLLFLLEELVLHLEENAQPLLLRPGPGLGILQVEIGRWLEMSGYHA
jgi:hypothetical protein